MTLNQAKQSLPTIKTMTSRNRKAHLFSQKVPDMHGYRNDQVETIVEREIRLGSSSSNVTRHHNGNISQISAVTMSQPSI